MSLQDLFAGALFAYEEEDEEAQPELRGIMAYSGSGRLCVLLACLPVGRSAGARRAERLPPLYACRYVVGDDGTIKAADVRQQLLSGAWAQVRQQWRLAAPEPLLHQAAPATVALPKPQA